MSDSVKIELYFDDRYGYTNDVSEQICVTISDYFLMNENDAIIIIEDTAYILYDDDVAASDFLTIYIPNNTSYTAGERFSYSGDYIDIDLKTEKADGSGFYYSTIEVRTESNLDRISIDGNIDFVCFTTTAKVLTPSGPVDIVDLAEGDLVVTRDHGAQPIRWMGTSTLTEETLRQFPEKRPISIAVGALGDHAATRVSPAHRVLLQGWRAQCLFGVDEALAPAATLLNGTTVCRDGAEDVTYVHILFDRHEVICADGLWSESFHPRGVFNSTTAATRDEIFELFPQFEVQKTWAAARPTLSPADVAVFGGV